jgi:hypothetical protein
LNRTPRLCRTITKDAFISLNSPKEERGASEKVLKAIIGENFSDWPKTYI